MRAFRVRGDVITNTAYILAKDIRAKDAGALPWEPPALPHLIVG
jgi:hypothetical protein